MNQALQEKSLPSRRSRAATQLDVGYRGSAIVGDDRDDTYQLRAGDRAPDATELLNVHGQRRLFELMSGGRFTLLNFGAAVPETDFPPEVRVLRIVDDPTENEDIADIGGHLCDAYAASEHTLVLIRPDGYISGISDAGDVSTLVKFPIAVNEEFGVASTAVRNRCDFDDDGSERESTVTSTSSP